MKDYASIDIIDIIIPSKEIKAIVIVCTCVYVCLYTALAPHQYAMQMEVEIIIICLNRRCG